MLPSVLAAATLCIAEGPEWVATEVTISLARKERCESYIAMAMFSRWEHKTIHEHCLCVGQTQTQRAEIVAIQGQEILTAPRNTQDRRASLKRRSLPVFALLGKSVFFIAEVPRGALCTYLCFREGRETVAMCCVQQLR